MILNPYSRAVIFDDEPEKIKPILDLFEQHLVPQLYINFSTAPGERDEKQKLKNIRLVFTDFIKGSLSGSSPSQLTNIINAIDSTISKNNGPMIIVTWSAHSMQFLGEFKKQLKEAGYIFETIVLDKEQYLETPNIENMLNDINKKLISKKSFIEFLNWENKVKKSASKIIEPFSNLNEKKRNDIIGKLSKASLGNAYDINADNLQKGLYNTMTNLLYDEIEKNINAEQVIGESIIDDNDIAEDIAYLNTRLMIDKSMLTNDNNYPGNVYNYSDFMNICINQHADLHDICGFTKEDLKNSIFLRDELSSIIDDDLEMICIEISPYCDHAQQNMKKAKLIAGFILNDEQKKKAKERSDFIYTGNGNQFFLRSNTEKSYLYLSFRHIFRVNPTFVSILTPKFRLRKEMVNEIQHQTAFYLSRPGLTTLYS